MNEKWYADNRDLVKWATLTYLAQRHGLDSILQVPYLRRGENEIRFTFAEEEVPVSKLVWDFFRNVHDVIRLGDQLGISISVAAPEFEPTRRSDYILEVKEAVGRARRPLILFLDPDTGLQPGPIMPEHTSRDEILQFWSVLRPREWLVLYQHARRNSTWVMDVQAELRDLCGGGSPHVSRSTDVGQDVAFFCIEKTNSLEQIA